MHGNVWEWCLDWSQSDLGSASATDPKGAATGANRSVRGGGWSARAHGCRSAFRYEVAPGYAYNYLGFRLAMGLPEE